MFDRVRLRLSLLYLAVGLLLMAIVGATAYTLMSRSFASETDQALGRRMDRELDRLGRVPQGGLSATAVARDTGSAPSAPIAYDPAVESTFTLYLDANGIPLATGGLNTPDVPPQRAAVLAALAHGSDRRTVIINGGTVRLLTYRVTGGGSIAAITVGRGTAEQERALRELALGLLMLGGAATVLLGAGSWFLAGRMLRPTVEAWERQQVFVANASHELRAPLTVLRASAEVAQRQLPPQAAETRALLDDVLGECDQLTALLTDLLLLSRLDAGVLQLMREPIALLDLLLEVGRGAGRLADARGVRLVVERPAADDPLVTRADRARLRQVMLILLDNALKYTPAGGRYGSRSDERASSSPSPWATPVSVSRLRRCPTSSSGSIGGIRHS